MEDSLNCAVFYAQATFHPGISSGWKFVRKLERWCRSVAAEFVVERLRGDAHRPCSSKIWSPFSQAFSAASTAILHSITSILVEDASWAMRMVVYLFCKNIRPSKIPHIAMGCHLPFPRSWRTKLLLGGSVVKKLYIYFSTCPQVQEYSLTRYRLYVECCLLAYHSATRSESDVPKPKIQVSAMTIPGIYTL